MRALIVFAVLCCIALMVCDAGSSRRRRHSRRRSRTHRRPAPTPKSTSQQYDTPAPAYHPPDYNTPPPAYKTPAPAYPKPAYKTPAPAYSTPKPAYSPPPTAYNPPPAAYTTPAPAYKSPTPYQAPYDRTAVFNRCKEQYCGEVLYFQRFCSGYTWRAYCYPGDSLTINRAEYGNFNCNPSNAKLTTAFSCGANSVTVRDSIASMCNGRTDCGHNPFPSFTSTCSGQNKFYVEYYCRHNRCDEYCNCVADNHDNASSCKSIIIGGGKQYYP